MNKKLTIVLILLLAVGFMVSCASPATTLSLPAAPTGPPGWEDGKGVPIPRRTTVPAGTAVIVMQTRFADDDSPVEIAICYHTASPEDLYFGVIDDHLIRDGWIGPEGEEWAIAEESCEESQKRAFHSLATVTFQGKALPRICFKGMQPE